MSVRYGAASAVTVPLRKMRCFLVLWKLLSIVVSYCILVWVLFVVYLIFGFALFCDSTTKKQPKNVTTDDLRAVAVISEHCFLPFLTKK